MAQPTVWGVDIGQCALKALRVRQAGDRIEALDHEFIEHAKVLSQAASEDERRQLVNDALKRFLDKHDLRGDRLVVAVPGQATLARFTKLPPVEAKKIPDIVQFEANQQIPFDMDDVVWDYQTFRTGDQSELELGIFAMRRDLLAEHLQPFVAAGVEPVAVQAAPLALYNAVRYDLAPDTAALLLDIGAQNTDLIVAEPNALWTRNIPLGGNHFTETLLKTFKISFAKAEQLKRTAATSKYARQIFQAMRPIFADLAAEIQRSMGFYATTHRGTRITKVIAMGNAFKLPGLQKFLQSNLGIDVIRPTTFAKLSVASAANAPQLIEHLLSFGVAYGLALQGLGLAAITSNLLPPQIAKSIVWRKKMPWFWVAAACLAASAALVWGRFFWDSSALAQAKGGFTGVPSVDLNQATELVRANRPPGENRAPLEFAGEVVGMADSLKKGCQDLEQQAETAKQEIEKITELQKDKTLWPRIWLEINRALPEPQKELVAAMAAGPDEYRKVAERIPRAERKQVFIQSMSVKFSKDVAQAYKQEISKRSSGIVDTTAGAAPPGAAAAPPPTGEGFLIQINGLTPIRDGATFLQSGFLSRLARLNKEAAQKQGCGFFFVLDPTTGYHCAPLASREGSGAGTGAQPAAYRSGAPTYPGGASPGPQFVDRTRHGEDPVTKEPMDKDWQFDLLLQVILDKGTPADAAGAPGGNG